MGGDSNTIELVRASGVERWPPQSKEAVARMLIERVAEELKRT
jgi:phosphopantothenoylcysteine decarboxylase/phosphopantothenate--cysteine ligase